MHRIGIDRPASRFEDAKLITGKGRYTSDVTLPEQCYAVFVRSPHAHARIRAIDTVQARRMPGFLALYTHDDLAAAGIGPLPHLFNLTQRDGSPLIEPPRPALADTVVRHVGDPIACIVADSEEQARVAAANVTTDYELLPSVTDLARADLPRSPQVWPGAPGNLCFDWELGDRATVEDIIENASHAVSLDLTNNRVTAASLEPRAAIGSVDPKDQRLTLHVGCQGGHMLRRQLARNIFHLPENQIRVVTEDVGGGFGMKLGLYPEYVLVLFAARQLGRPVKWVATRRESFRTDTHGRDHLTRAELALDESGRFLALKVDTLANLGAYLATMGAFTPSHGGSRMLAGCYTLPAVHVRVRGLFTNTAPVDAYRGAGRPEAAFCLERLVDKAARILGYDQAELRRRNFIPPSAMPYTTATGVTYDCGDFAKTQDQALAQADAAGFETRRIDAQARGRLRGLGHATYIEAAAGGPPEQATLEVATDGRVTALVGTQSNGQGHETAFTQLLANQLGLDPTSVIVVQGDTDRVPAGGGTFGSRSVPVGGAALADATTALIAAVAPAAARILDVTEDRLQYAHGAFRCLDSNRFVTFSDVAAGQAPPPGRPAFSAQGRWRPSGATFPNGTHVCEVEIDPETGIVEIVRYTAVDDCGIELNPTLLRGQICGGIAQGLGQSLHEQIVHADDSGLLLTDDFQTYCLPRAENLPNIDISFAGIPCRTNPLGLKGAGEAGAIGAPPAVINAIVDALSLYGVLHIDMPATPMRIWRLIRGER